MTPKKVWELGTHDSKNYAGIRDTWPRGFTRWHQCVNIRSPSEKCRDYFTENPVTRIGSVWGNALFVSVETGPETKGASSAVAVFAQALGRNALNIRATKALLSHKGEKHK